MRGNIRARYYSILLIIALVVGTINLTSFTSHAATEGLYDYSVDALGNTVLVKYLGSEQNVTIPDTLGGNPVTTIGSSCFNGKSSIKSVTMPDSIVEIRDGAFGNCLGLETINLSSNLQKVGQDVFANTQWLRNQQDGMVYLDYIAYGYKGVMPVDAEIAINAGATLIPTRAFVNQPNLKSITLPDGIVMIGDQAFGDCTGLTAANIPDSVDTIGNQAFDGCQALKAVIIPSGVETIGQHAFYECSSISEINIPSTVKNMGAGAFYGCTGLLKATVEEGVSSLNVNAFYGCTNLVEVKLPSTLKGLGGSVFGDCSKLSIVNIPEGITYIDQYAFGGCAGIKDLTVPGGVESIGYSAFKGCTGLTTLEISEGVTVIDDFAFQNCSALETITIPDSITYMGSYVFDGTAWLTAQPDGLVYLNHIAYQWKGTMGDSSVTFDPKTTAIAGSAFVNQGALAQIEIPDGISSIGPSAFENCWSASTLALPASLKRIGKDAFNTCTSLTSVTLNEGLTQIENNTFNNCYALVTVNFPSTLESIGYGAFDNCYMLANLVFPEGLTTIGADAFYGCRQLTSIEFPSSLEAIGDSAFYRCSKLTTISFPDDLSTIGANAFIGTPWYGSQPDGMIYINKIAYDYKGSMASGTDYALLPGTVGISSYAFDNCDGMRSLTIPGSVKTMGTNLFFNCSYLTTVIIEEGVTTIPQNAFLGSSVAPSYIMPNSVTKIESGNFFVNTGNKIVAYKNSYAYNYATAYKVPYALLVEVNFNSNGGTVIPSYIWRTDKKIVEPTTPQRSGYAFAGWFKDANLQSLWNFSYNMPVDNMTLYAKWTPNLYSINLNGNGATSGAMDSMEMTYDGPQSIPANLYKRTGYAFLGWALTPSAAASYADMGTVNNLTPVSEGVVDLYAKWGAPITSAASYSYTSLKVSWTAACSATSYKIYRATSASGSYYLVHTSASTTRSWIDTGRTTGKYYYYKVYPVTGGTTYKFSTYKYAKAVPATPRVALSKYSSNAVNVAWTGVSGATKYQIYRATSATGTYTYLHTASSTAESWTNTGLTAGKTYYYKVRAYHLEGTTKVYGSFSAVKYLKI